MQDFSLLHMISSRYLGIVLQIWNGAANFLHAPKTGGGYNVQVKASPIKVVPVLVFGKESLALGLFVDVVVVILFDVRVNNGDELTAMLFQPSLHHLGGREVRLVPGKVSAGRVLSLCLTLPASAGFPLLIAEGIEWLQK